MNKKISILGTEYAVNYLEEEEDSRAKGTYGFTDSTTKEIGIVKVESEPNSVKDMNKFQQRVVRHEIVHAFFEESGLGTESEFARNEELVDWIAYQIPKIYRACQEAEAI